MDEPLIDRLVMYFSPERGLKRSLMRKRRERMERSFEGAGKSRRTEGWRSTGTDANAALAPAAAVLRQRARDLRRNNPYAERAISGISANVIGYGIIPAPKAATTRAQKKVESLWKEWGETTQCDADGRHDFYGLQSLICEAIVESGEVLIRRRYRRAADGLALPFQLQVLEADFLDDQKNQTLKNGGKIINGIEFDALGRRVAYWLFSEHPGANVVWGSTASNRIPAEDIIHVFLQKRPGQVRGYTWLAPVMMRLRNFDEMEDAIIEQAKIAACFAAFVTSDASDNVTETQPLIDRVEPGLIERLGAGDGVTFGNPPTFSGLQPYSWQSLHAIAVGMGVPYELLTGDLAGVNFSSGRMGWLEFGRNIDTWRWKMIIPQMCRQVWGWVNEALPLVGVMEPVPAEWTPPRRDMVDPAKEMDVWTKKVRAGAMPLVEGLRELGYSDPSAVLAQYAETNKLLDSLGLVFDTDPRKVTGAGIAQPEQPEKEG